MILHTGVSLDGFIARLDGTLDWLNCVHSAADTSIYSDFLRSCDTALMGRATFEQVREFVDKDNVKFPYTEMDTYVFSKNKSLDVSGLPVRIIDEDAVKFVRDLMARPSTKNIHLIGGGRLNGALLKAGLIHQIVLSIVPTVIGQGVRLFEGLPDMTSRYRTLASTTFSDSGLVQITLESITETDSK